MMAGVVFSFWRLARPRQWVKNAFVLVGVFFGHSMATAGILMDAALAFAAFCAASSAVYAANDALDFERDRLHAKKALRPIASGAVSRKEGFAFGAGLAALGVLLGFSANWRVGLCVLGYLALNALYVAWTKGIAILDVFSISAGFMIRLVAGTAAIGLAPSRWLMFCGMMVTLFLGFSKRLSELMGMGSEAKGHRPALAGVDEGDLAGFAMVCAAATLVSYGLYATDPQTVALHGTENLVFTVPFVAYGLFRFMLLTGSGRGGDASVDMLRDRHLLFALLGWGCLTGALVFF